MKQVVLLVVAWVTDAQKKQIQSRDSNEEDLIIFSVSCECCLVIGCFALLTCV